MLPRLKQGLATLLVSSLILQSCGGGAKTTDEIVFKYRIHSDPPSLDPAHGTDTTSGNILLRMFDGLVQFEPKTMEVIPAVAESWEIEDSRVFTFKIRKGVKFHNGREVKAEDFKYSFERTLDPETVSERQWVLSPILGATEFTDGKAGEVKGIEVIDDYTLRLTLEKSFAPFLSMLCMESASVVPKEAVDEFGSDQFARNPIGCGPFKFVEWQSDISVTVEAFDDYYGDKSETIDKVKFMVIPSIPTALEAYKNGEIDFLDELPPGQIQNIRDNSPDDVKEWSQIGTYYIGFNHEKPPFKDNVKLRKAINYAIDRQKIANIIEEGLAIPASGILSPGIPGHNPNFSPYKYDLEKAKQLMAEAGYPEGKGLPTIKIWYNTHDRHQRIVQYVQQELKKIGVNLEIKNLDWAAYLKALDSGEPEMYRMGWLVDYVDPDNFLYTLLHTSQIGAPGNYARYTSAKFDSLVELGRHLTDLDERIKVYQEAERIAVEDDAVWLFLYYYREIALINPKWENVILSPQGDFVTPIRYFRLKGADKPLAKK
ncbi:MAG: ABC transporter substrate-binding protein [Calditrichaeota bacterium]|nr:MAG: ABC transporter substrate-binding protein [Calditrichota bacterium]